MKDPVEAGEFPPCIQVTQDEVKSIRELTSYRTVEETEANEGLPLVSKEAKEVLVKRDQNLLNILGRVANWCKAYHARIGYVEPAKEPQATPDPD